MSRTRWTDDMVADRIRGIASKTGVFPSISFLRESGQNDLACQITRRGGSFAWADRLGLKREHSDSDTGWEGEVAVQGILEAEHFRVERQSAVRWPFDLLVNGVLRVDVKAARFATYGPCSGWFYRIGKAPQADLIALHQLDTGTTYWIPWVSVPTSNITISKDGGKWAPFRNAIGLVAKMSDRREWEAEESRRFQASY